MNRYNVERSRRLHFPTMSADLKAIIWEIPFRSTQRLGASLAHSRRKGKNFLAQGLSVLFSLQAASQHTSKPARTPTSQPATRPAWFFWLFSSPGFAQAPRKVWRKVYKFFSPTPVFDSKGTSASNHSCIKPAKASLLVAPLSLSLDTLCKKYVGSL